MVPWTISFPIGCNHFGTPPRIHHPATASRYKWNLKVVEANTAGVVLGGPWDHFSFLLWLIMVTESKTDPHWPHRVFSLWGIQLQYVTIDQWFRIRSLIMQGKLLDAPAKKKKQHVQYQQNSQQSSAGFGSTAFRHLWKRCATAFPVSSHAPM